MEEKYYTPIIEEFHRGFVYEYKSNTMFGSLSNTNGEWKQVDFYGASGAEDEHSEMEDIEFALDAGKLGIEVRVKYLDQEDIKEVGWKEKNDTTCFIFKEDKTYYISHTKEMGYLIQWGYGENPGLYTWLVFRGTIKNKSELKKLMQQLGINASK